VTRPRNLGSTPAPSQERVARRARAVSRARLLLSSLSLSPYIYIYIYIYIYRGRERYMYICMQLLHITFIITSSIFIYNHHIYSIVSAQHKLPWAAAVWRPPHSPPRPPKRETERERQ